MRTCATTSPDFDTSDITPDIAAVFRAAQRGEPGCWEEIVHRYRGVVQAAVGQYRLTAHDRADAAQNTWLRLFEKAHTIHDPTRLAGWLATTARRECLALLTRARREQTTDVGWDERVSVDAGPEALAVGADERRIVRAAAAELPARSARLIDALFAQAPASYVEISARLDMPVGSIGPTRSRIMRRLRDRLEQVAA